MEPPNFSASIIVGFHRLDLCERDSSRPDGLRRIEARSEGIVLGELALVASAYPSFAVPQIDKQPELVIWAESDVYLLKIQEQQLHYYEHFDAVGAAYFLDGNWCLVGDASVTIVDLARSAEVLRYEHDEIIKSSWWEDRTLRIKDLRDRILRFANLDPQQATLRPSMERPKDESDAVGLGRP